MTTAALRLLLPEIIVIAAAVAIYTGGAFYSARRSWRWIAVAALALAAVVLYQQQPRAVADGSMTFDQLACFGRWFALVVGALLVLVAFRPQHSGGTPEYLGSLLLVIAGLMLVAVANDLVLLFAALELISIPTYILLYLGRRDASSQESATKYFFLSVLASAILLYGFSFLYGIGGSTNLTTVRSSLQSAPSAVASAVSLAKLAMVLIFAGLCFRIAAVPFHFYAPDVYQGTTQSNAALLSVIPKAAGLLAMVRLLAVTMPSTESYSWRLVLVIAVLTMTFGNVLALWQDDLRRLLAYSSIANAGYMLIALAVGLVAGATPATGNGLGAMWFYLAVYALGTIGAFATIEYLGRPGRRIDAVDELAGLGQTRPTAAGMLAVCMFSLAGIPVLAGFWGKFFVFANALYVQPDADGSLRWWFIIVAVIGVLNAAVAAAYYLRIVAIMYFRPSLATPRAEGGRPTWLVGLACAVLLIAIGLYPDPLVRAANSAQPLVVEALAAASDIEPGEAKAAAIPVGPNSRSDGAKGESRGGLSRRPAS